jgi:twitching motility protein PilT
MNPPPLLTKILRAAVARGASDVHAKAGDVVRARVNGQLAGLTKQRLTPEQTRALAATFAGLALDDPRLDTLRDFDCSWGAPGVGRFRVNVLRQRSSFSVVLRVIPFSVPTTESLHLPDVVGHFAELEGGLVLVAGLAGSGKSSTIAAMVHHVNRLQVRHVITLEDPIEFLHRDLSASITQREVGTDTEDLATGIRAALRQDPDVLVVGDLRDPLAADRAIRAAESGVLVLATITAADVAGAITQLVATLLPDEREVGRMRLASVLSGVMAQRLLPGRDGEPRRPQVEWVEGTPELGAAIASGTAPDGLRQAIARAAQAGQGETFAMLDGSPN